MMEHTGVTMRGQEHEQGRVEGVSPTEFMGVKIRVKISPWGYEQIHPLIYKVFKKK